MNEAERGIAAYQAAAKADQSSRRRKKRNAAQPEEVTVELSSRGTSPGFQKVPKSSDTGRTSDGQPNPPKNFGTAKGLLSGGSGNRRFRKVAKFLLLLGKEEAAEILKHFDAEEVEAISREIAEIKSIDKAEARALLAEFGVAGSRSRGFPAGPATAKQMLTAAFGETRAEKILNRALPETRERPFRFLNEIDDHQILLLLRNEAAPTTSVVLPYLLPQKAARVLESLPPDLQKETIRRIAKLKKVDPEVIVRIEGTLKERIRTQGKVITEEIDGRDALANILKHLEYSQEEKILGEIASFDPELSEDVKNRLFTIELVFKIDDADLQAILRDYDDEEIATVLKAKTPRIREHIFSNLSSRRQAIVEEEMARLGKMRKSDVDSATKDFVDYLVDLDDQGKITIRWDDEVAE